MRPKTTEEIAILFTGICSGVDQNRELMKDLKHEWVVVMRTLAWCLGARLAAFDMFYKLSLDGLEVGPEAVLHTADSLCKDFEKEELKVNV
ncbi:MAG TPA: hypothetical protein VII94_00100 [Candidatus Saccharimonadales bacterium]